LRYLLLLVCLAGCTSAGSTLPDKDKDDDYVVIRQSCGMIMDVWVLDGASIRPWNSSGGWKFLDNDGNGITARGDCKVINIKDKEDLKLYHEYHSELEAFQYRWLYNRIPKRYPPFIPPRPGWVQPPMPEITFEEPA